MPNREWLVLMGMGGLFILLGLAAIFWGLEEERGYFNTQMTRHDVRESLERPSHPQPTALKIGGRIAIVVGIFLLGLGGWIHWL